MDRGLVHVMLSQAWKLKGAGQEPPLRTIHVYTHLHTPGHTHTLYTSTHTYSMQVMLTSHAFTLSRAHRHVRTHTHTSGLWALRFAPGVRGGWPSGPLGFPSPLGTLSSVTGPRGGGCLARGVGLTGSSSPLYLGTPGQQCEATASVCTCVCWYVLCVHTRVGCESMARPAVSEPHFQPCPIETVVLEDSVWQSHGPYPDLPTRARTQAWTPHAAWGRDHTPCGPPRTLSGGPALCPLWGGRMWAPLPQPRLRSKAQWALAVPRPCPTQNKHTCKCFQKQAKAEPQSRWGPGWKAPLTLRPKQQNPDPGHLHRWGRGPGWARWLGWFLTTLPPGPGPRPRPRPLPAAGPACAAAGPE